MLFSVRHRTFYSYSAPVRLGGHVLRLHPRALDVMIRSESLRIEPEPIFRAVEVDPDGNRTTRVEFDGATDRLLIESVFELETCAPGPLAAAALPWRETAGFDPGPKVRAYACDLFARSGGDALLLLDALNRDLFSRTERRIRDAGYAQEPEDTLLRRKGACRDLTLLFMAAARSLGFSARFVSGYQAQAETPDGKRHLHAWPEVLLPGVGWRGYDPTHGLVVSDGHVALCAGADQRATMPVEGGFYGDGVSSTLAFELVICAE
ncbi:transglutaminase-like putative cysteine protease [Rhodoblastus acidophilus]|uniref:transglutaminase family protein n=1 Tax=Rhodoblastus acidophilus TaxID=1074 RepID=UPI002224C201|nr:transglutaminase family protein [Rhodoblastus acidophilus]MCW2283034.1 transglutaminase-like putative cysteine protease [Rhodoblastus acidophilus]MCW2331915.1 transglutaminase-like putative cysteine protease [Rhodoblastus acidophilus]